MPEKEGSENNKADYHSQHAERFPMQKSQACKSQAEFEVRETLEEFEKDIMAIVKSSVPEAVTWQELLEETQSNTELSDVKGAIATGYFTAQEERALGPQYDSIFTKVAVVGGLVVRGSRIVVPGTLRYAVVKLTHKGHQPECGFQG